MIVKATVLANSAFAASTDTTIYTVPGSTTAIIDKFTATNTDVGAQTLNINIIPAAGTVGASNLVLSAFSIAAGATKDFTELQNQILAAGDKLSVKASSASKIVVRGSGREIT